MCQTFDTIDCKVLGWKRARAEAQTRLLARLPVLGDEMPTRLCGAARCCTYADNVARLVPGLLPLAVVCRLAQPPPVLACIDAPPTAGARCRKRRRLPTAACAWPPGHGHSHRSQRASRAVSVPHCTWYFTLQAATSRSSRAAPPHRSSLHQITV